MKHINVTNTQGNKKSRHCGSEIKNTPNCRRAYQQSDLLSGAALPVPSPSSSPDASVHSAVPPCVIISYFPQGR